MRSLRSHTELGEKKARGRVARSVAVILTLALLQTIIPIGISTSQAAAGNVGTTTTSGTCASDVGETSSVTVTFVNDSFCLIKFNQGTSWTVPIGVNTIDILVVGGGGGGGADGGGGGGGGEVLAALGILVTAGSSGTATVGTGGAGGHWFPGLASIAGGSTSFAINGTNYSAGGGVGGVGWQAASNNAARGSGGTNGTAVTGGTNYSYGGTNSSQVAGYTTGFGGVGYDGVSTSFTGSSVTFAGGGGGGICTNNVSDPTFGGLAGGAGGGGRGSIHTYNVGSDAGQPGTNGLGGGGGAGAACNDGGTNGTNARTAGGRGGDGVVYIKYVPIPAITTNPDSKTGAVGAIVTFTATPQTASTGPTRTRKWQVFSSGSWSDLASTDSNSYTTPAITRLMHGWMYRLVVTDTFGTVSSTTYSTAATLSVVSPYLNGDTDTSLSLNGTNQYAEVADTTSSPFDLTGTLTLEAWVYPTSTCSGSGAVISKLSYLLYCSVGVWKVMLLADGATGSGVASSIPVTPNEWHHIAVTKTASSSTTSFYYDGILVDNLVTTTSMTPNNHAFQIGRWDNNAYYFQGKIDEVRVYNTQRTQAQIQSDMHSYGNVSETGLVAYYDFNEGAGNTLYNRVAGAANGTDLAISISRSWSDIKLVDTTSLAAYTIVKFPRSYLTASGGWKVPANVSKASALVVAGGGGGGSRAGGGGGAGGLVYRPLLTLTPNAVETITVGQGGTGGIFTSVNSVHQGINGQNSQMGSHSSAIGGGGGGGAGESGNTYRVGLDGGSGGGASGAAAGDGSSAAYGLATQSSAPRNYGLGNRGGSGVSGTYWNGGGGGGSGGSGVNSSTTSWVAGNGGAGTLDPVGGSNLCLAAGGGGATVNTGSAAGNGGACSSGTVTAGAGTIGSVVGNNATANSGSGGGGSGYSGSADVDGGNGGSGVIIVRWITASKPIFTQPTIDTTTAGVTDTITVSSDAISPLTRNYLWQFSNDTGTSWNNIVTGSGYSSQVYTTPTLETTTSGIRYQYRVVVTDSDTAGLFIVDTSTAVYIIINPRIVITGSYTVQKYGATHVDTFTTVAGTGTGSETFTFTPNNRSGISWNGSTPNQATLTISRTLGPGTYYETMTATDTKGATTQLGISIVVNKADTITVTSLSKTDTYTSNALTFSPSYMVTGLQNSDTVTAITWSYSGNDNSSTAYGPSATKPINAGTYTITPSATITNSDSYTAVSYVTSTLTVNRATRTLSTSISPSPLKFGATGAITATPSAGSGDGVISYSTSNTDSCTVTTGNVQAIKSSGTCVINTYITRGANYETATASSVNIQLTKADTLSVIVNSITPVTYTGSPAAVSPTVTVAGLVLSNSVAASPVTYSYVGQGNTGPSCAQGGTCVVGDTGPGGGIVFYVAPSLQSWGRYLEAAPANWSGGPDNQASNISKWCEASPSIDGTRLTGLYLGLGLGYSNTYDTRLNVCTGGAIYKARAYRGGGYTNWFLPNSTELALMADASVRNRIGLVNDATLWGYWGSYEDASTGYIGSLVTSSWGIGSTTKNESAKNMTRPIRAFAEGGVGTTTFSSPPTDAGTYAVKASALTLSSGSLSDYQGVTYTDGSLFINRAQQLPLVIAQYAAIFGTPYKVMVYGGSGIGALTETVTAGTALGCTIIGDTVTSTSVGTCQVFATKAQDKNYETATAVAYIYFLTYVINQPVAASVASSDIALSGATALTVDTTTPPSITGLSTLTLSIAGGGTFTITGTGFNASGLTVKFWRNKVVVPTASTSTSITLNFSDIGAAGATTGRVTVITVNGQDFSTDTLTIRP